MLKDSQIAKDIEVAKKLTKIATESLSKINNYILDNNKEGLLEELFNYERISEKIVNNARLLPMATGVPLVKNQVKKIIIEENNIDIKYSDEGWFCIKIPSLLPKKEKGDSSYIRASLDIGMKEFFTINEKKKFQENCIIIFKHNYSKERTYREYRDHDNIELNSIVDIVALYVLIDDSPMKTQHYYCSDIQEKDSTEVFIVPIKDFVLWLNKYEKR